MNGVQAAILPVIITLGLNGAALSMEETAMAKTYHMMFSGDAGARFSGRCAVATRGGGDRHDD